ncbi:MAG: GatB/YqeY domain-containing protein [Candidatus Omnitrophota bacterium]
MLVDSIFNDYKAAMKSRDVLKSSVLSFLRAEMLNQATAKKKDKLDDAEIFVVIKKQIKQRQDSIEQFTKGGRIEAADKEKKELEILKCYLPAEMPQEQIKSLIEELIVVTGASSMKDMGKLMKELTEKIAGKADGKLVSDLVRQRLSIPS